jgi:hypothetical protein
MLKVGRGQTTDIDYAKAYLQFKFISNFRVNDIEQVLDNYNFILVQNRLWKAWCNINVSLKFSILNTLNLQK